MDEVIVRLIHEPSSLTDQEIDDLLKSSYDDDKPYTHALAILEQEVRRAAKERETGNDE